MTKFIKRTFTPFLFITLLVFGVFAFFSMNSFGWADSDSSRDNIGNTGIITGNDYMSEAAEASEALPSNREPFSQGIMEDKREFSRTELTSLAEKLEGAPYQSGGSHPENGFNSSGFVQYVYEEATGVRMPRLAAHQQELGFQVSPEDLKPGDVVFFEGSSIMSGLYIGGGQAMTASESSGVTSVDLEGDTFWSRNFTGGKRLTENEIESLQPRTYKDHDHPAVREAMNYLDTPYEFGSSSLEAYDCSFFVQEVFREHMDVYLPRVTLDQFETGEHIPRDSMKPGDVIYFSDVDIESSDREEGDVTHTGIYVGNNFMIHASRTEGKTQISYLNDYWNDAFTGVKRFDDLSLHGESAAVTEAARHLTVPYSGRGQFPGDGFNPAGFVRYVYAVSENIELPSSGERMMNAGEKVDTDRLEPGDVLFFEGESGVLPGIYSGNGFFMTATHSAGVTTRHMERSEFFAERYKGARRY